MRGGCLPHRWRLPFIYLFFKLKRRIHHKNKWNMYGIGGKNMYGVLR
jgi:hypothetical protein